jgi:hypothetical protein
VARPESAQQANERIAVKAARLEFVSRLPLHCECSNPDCDALVLVDHDAYRKAAEHGYYLTSPGHGVTAAEVCDQQEGYWVHRPIAA